MIINSNEPIDDPKDVLDGARASARDSSGDYEEMAVADARAALAHFDYGTFQLSVPFGGCAVVMLIDQDRQHILAVESSTGRRSAACSRRRSHKPFRQRRARP